MSTKEFNHPAYVNVPYFVLKDKKLDFFNKLLFSFLWSFSVAGKKIKASNDYLADLFEVSDKHIQNRLKMLEDLGFIKRTVIKYKRVIEITHLVLINIESDSPNISLVPTTVGGSTNVELPPTTVGVSHQPQLVPAPTTVGTYNKAIPKKDIKITPISPSGKKDDFGLSQMLEKNPFKIPEPMISDWLQVRKTKRAKITATAWSSTNSVMQKLVDMGLDAIECFETMVASGWQGMKVSYFKKIDYQKSKTETAERERIANQQKISDINAGMLFKNIQTIAPVLKSNIPTSDEALLLKLKCFVKLPEKQRRLAMGDEEYYRALELQKKYYRGVVA